VTRSWRQATLFLATITASIALTALPASAWAASAATGRHPGAAAGASLTRPALPAVTGTVAFINEQSLHDDSPADQCLGIDREGQAGNWYCTFENDQAWDLGREWGSSHYYELVNKKGQCLGVSGASKAEGARVVGFACIPSHPDQYWTFDQINNPPPYGNTGDDAIVNLNSGYVLGVSGGSPDNGAAIVQWPWNAEINQWWRPCLSADGCS
jgi:hypothetical protein